MVAVGPGMYLVCTQVGFGKGAENLVREPWVYGPIQGRVAIGYETTKLPQGTLLC